VTAPFVLVDGAGYIQNDHHPAFFMNERFPPKRLSARGVGVADHQVGLCPCRPS
jgi:hypothetical protein